MLMYHLYESVKDIVSSRACITMSCNLNCLNGSKFIILQWIHHAGKKKLLGTTCWITGAWIMLVWVKEYLLYMQSVFFYPYQYNLTYGWLNTESRGRYLSNTYKLSTLCLTFWNHWKRKQNITCQDINKRNSHHPCCRSSKQWVEHVDKRQYRPSEHYIQ